MITIIVGALRRAYRANPYRPHCDSANGRHVLLCRLLAQQEHC